MRQRGVTRIFIFKNLRLRAEAEAIAPANFKSIEMLVPLNISHAGLAALDTLRERPSAKVDLIGQRDLRIMAMIGVVLAVIARVIGHQRAHNRGAFFARKTSVGKQALKQLKEIGRQKPDRQMRRIKPNARPRRHAFALPMADAARAMLDYAFKRKMGV